MSMTFTKLFSSITESTIWVEDAHTRLVWITMLAMADRRGRVWASIPGLANRARVPLKDCEAALERFLSPDKYSRTFTEECQGRRIREIDGGWQLINYKKYRDIRDEETTKEQTAARVAKHRAKKRNVTNVTLGNDNAEAEAEADKEKRGSTARGARLTLTELPDDWYRWALTDGNKPHSDVLAMWETFHDHWVAQPGQKGVKLDWFATWRNWVRREKTHGTRQPSYRKSAVERVRDATAAAFAEPENLERVVETDD